MNFFKNLFGNANRKEEPFVPSPIQTIPGLEPIVVYTVEILYPSTEEQKYAFTYLLKQTEENDTLAQLSLLRMGIKNLESIMEKNPALTIRYAVYSEGFSNMKAAKKWVKSITKSNG
jgi:hypothetical protein